MDEQPPATLSWLKPAVNGRPPSARGGHSAVLADFQLVVFGGHYYAGQGEFVYLNDTHVLDVETMTWHPVQCDGDGPMEVLADCAVKTGFRLFMEGRP